LPRKPLDFFGEDSPLFTKPAPKKKVVKKKLAVPKPKRARKKVDLTGAFVEKKEPKKRGPKSKAELEEEAILLENKRIAKNRAARAKKAPKKAGKVYPSVKSPADCKNILPAFKKLLNEKWELLKGTHQQADTVASWISGAMSVCKEKRPKEYDELYVLRAIAKRIYNERN
jgi:hypothetical protein